MNLGRRGTLGTSFPLAPIRARVWGEQEKLPHAPHAPCRGGWGAWGGKFGIAVLGVAMTSGKADRLQKVADDVVCTKCHINPRFGSLARCKACLKLDAEAERTARERLLPPQQAARSNRQQASGARARKPAETPTGKSLVPAQPVQPVPKQTRDSSELFTVKSWTAMAASWLTRFLRAKPAEQREKAERAMAAEHTVQHVDHARVTYGGVPQIVLFPRTNEDLAHAHWGLERQGMRIDMVDTFGSVEDVKRLCEFCGARVRVPCNAPRANACRNRIRNW